MEDDKLKSLFSDFDPKLTSDIKFMSTLRANLNSVEIVRRHNAEARSRNKRAVVISASAGFFVGFLFSLALPYMSEAVAHWQLTLPGKSIMNILANNFNIISWLAIGAVSVFAALNAYEVSLSLLAPSKQKSI